MNVEENVQKSGIEIYVNPDNSVRLEVKFEKETVWLNVNQMAMLFGRDRSVIARHIRNVFNEGEIDRTLGCAKFAQTKDYGRRDGFTQELDIECYNLDVIISVGYRVHSKQGTQFRQWANSVLKQYLIKGYAINQQIKLQRYQELKDTVALMSRTLSLQESPTQDEYLVAVRSLPMRRMIHSNQA